MRASGLIDVHHHFVPDDYRQALDRSGKNPPDGMPALPTWSEDKAMEFLDETGIETAFLSISSPGVLLDNTAAVDLARMVNEIASGLVTAHPGRFGSFASLPLPDVGASLDEVAFALDDLHLDGIALLTNHGGIHLGDPRFDPIFDEVNRRKATVFIHPTSPGCCGQLPLGLPAPVLEFMFETTRAVTNLISSGTFDRCPDISWIIPHAGATLPVLASRMEMTRALAPDHWQGSEPVSTYLARLHYDLAGPRDAAALRALLGIADPSHLLYGSDWPFTPDRGVALMLEALRGTSVLSPDELEQVLDGTTARRLLAAP